MAKKNKPTADEPKTEEVPGAEAPAASPPETPDTEQPPVADDATPAAAPDETPAETPAEVSVEEPPLDLDPVIQASATIVIPMPTAELSGYMPTSIHVSLSGEQAATLRIIRQGLVEAGAKIPHPDDTIRRLLDLIRTQLKV